jgi:hypothetical protein
MSTIPADRLIELDDRLQAAQDILDRAAVILASPAAGENPLCVSKLPTGGPHVHKPGLG